MIAASLTGAETRYTTEELYDPLGRLYGVSDPSGPGGGMRDTDYVGDVVLYVEDGVAIHSARVQSVDSDGNTVKVIGKWGQGPIVGHHPAQRDAESSYGTTREYYRQKPRARKKAIKRQEKLFGGRRTPDRVPAVVPPI